MKTDTFALRRQLLDFLCTTCPPLTEALKQTRQVYPGNPGPFHAEDSVWTHTLLVLQAALSRPDFTLEDVLCALVHDFAKPLSATVRPAREGPGHRVSFIGHGPLGTQPAVDFLCAFQTAFPGMVTDGEIVRIAACVSGHIAFYDLHSADEALLYCNNDAALCRTMLRLLWSDLQGDFLLPDQPSFLSNLALLEDAEALMNDASAGPAPEPVPGEGIHLLCGLPSEAKARFAEAFSAGRPLLALPETARDPVQLQDWLDGHAGTMREALARGLVLTMGGLSRRERKAFALELRARFPRAPLRCVFVLSPSEESWLPEMPPASFCTGLPAPVPELVLPCLYHESCLDGAAAVLVR